MKEFTGKLKSLIADIECVCESHGRKRVNGAVASERTFRMQMDVMKQFARTLHEAGFEIEKTSNLGEKHLNAVFDVWVLKKELSNKTLQNQKSRIKQFLKWLGKPQLADYISQIEKRYLDKLPQGFRVTTIAEHSKSWRQNNIDLNELFRKGKAEDARFGAMLLMERAFGLRKKEVLQVNPWRAFKAEHLNVRENIAKGGKPRSIEIREGQYGEMQKRVLAFAREHCRRGENMAWPELSLAQAERRYYYLCARIGLTRESTGMTGHGLRAGFAEDMMLLDGILPSVLGGVTEMSTRKHRMISKLNIAQAMGHNRPRITGAYSGQDKRFARAPEMIGHLVGAPMMLSKEVHAQLLVSEKPVEVEGRPGQYELPGELAQLTFVTIQIIKGEVEISRQSLNQFLSDHPVAFEAVHARLGSIGLTLHNEED